jgi:hypothetical protein
MRYCDGDHDGDEGDDAPGNSQVGGVRSHQIDFHYAGRDPGWGGTGISWVEPPSWEQHSGSMPTNEHRS